MIHTRSKEVPWNNVTAICKSTIAQNNRHLVKHLNLKLIQNALVVKIWKSTSKMVSWQQVSVLNRQQRKTNKISLTSIKLSYLLLVTEPRIYWKSMSKSKTWLTSTNSNKSRVNYQIVNSCKTTYNNWVQVWMIIKVKQ